MKNADKQPIYFGATYMTLNNPFFEVINDEIKSVIESNGDVLITMDPALSKEKQVEQIQYLINQQVKVLFVNPLDVNDLHDVLEECRSKGMIVIAVDTNLKEGDYVSHTVVSNNYEAGMKAAKQMMSQYEKADIVLLEHSSTSSGSQRIQGFVDSIADNRNYRIVARKECEGQLEIANPIMTTLIEQKLHFDVVMALNDPSALGAMAALQEAGIQDVSVYGVDGTPEVKRLINDGKPIYTVAQSPIQMGKRAVNVAYGLLANKQFKTDIDYIPVTLINSENIAQYSLDGWQ
ncbi:MAG: sugar ABC transporter substrate-binding protein [Erysipelotrichia bacterium]|nr:sugar ABC transporter substrate-binding protein [Erysipelotrichia bacterium]NCC54261.1 sugar ABC transporter substrate-binding protein [Erysipelotrichia bacterium]